MKSINVKLIKFTKTAQTKSTLDNMINPYKISHLTNNNDIYVYGFTFHKVKAKRARMDYVIKNKLMTKSKLKKHIDAQGLNDKVNPIIRYTDSYWTAVVTSIPKCILDINRQKVQQYKHHWKLVTK